MLTVRDIASMPGLGLAVAGGSEGLSHEVRWLHVSELSDPTAWLEGGELLLTTGLGVGDLSSTQRAYTRRLAGHGLAGLLFGLGFGFAEVPPAIVEEANRLGFPVLAIPYDTPFIAITKAAFTHLANEQLDRPHRGVVGPVGDPGLPASQLVVPDHPSSRGGHLLERVRQHVEHRRSHRRWRHRPCRRSR